MIGGKQIRAALLYVGIAGLLAWSLFNWGRQYERTQWTEHQAEAVAHAAELKQEGDRIFGRALGVAREETKAAEAHAAKLLQQLQENDRERKPIARCTAAPAPVLGDSVDAATSEPPPAAAGPVVLTGFGLRVWNSALAGHDVPAGACGADDGTDRACAADTDVTLDDAWRNHVVNAESCRIDRARYRQLVDALKKTAAIQGQPQ